jgi:hypothetical protein
MAIGTCRTDGCDNPRRVRRGLVEPLCEECYWRAPQQVADKLATEETAAERRKRFRRFQINPGQQGSAQQASANTRSKPPAADNRKRGRLPEKKRGRGGPRLISEELLAEARRRHEQERRPLGQIARDLLAQTGYANARSAEMALRHQFKRRGWSLHCRRRGRARTVRAGGLSGPNNE